MKREQRYFTRLCAMTQKQLKEHARKELSRYYPDIVSAKGYLLARGNAPIMLTAHLDTVHKQDVRTVRWSRGRVSSPQGIGGDDRCGVFIILTLLSSLPDDIHPHVLLCEDEEIGGVGSALFTSTPSNTSLDVNHIVELDRKGATEAVFYDCGNVDYHSYIESLTCYKYATGSFSDCCNLSPFYDVASVNLSVGYYKAHTLDEYVVFSEMLHTRNVVHKLVTDAPNTKRFEYDEITYTSYNLTQNYNSFMWSEWEISAYVNGSRTYEVLDARSYDEAIGAFLSLYPDTTYHDIMYCDIIPTAPLWKGGTR